MTIAINSSSVSISIDTRPTVLPPTVDGTSAHFEGTKIEATGTVRLTGAVGDNPAGWTLGFIQMQWIETNWAYYEGQQKIDGSLMLQMGKPPARSEQGCRDHAKQTAVNTDVFYNDDGNEVAVAADTFPLDLSATMFDNPFNLIKLVETNSLTSKPNFLREAQLEFHFCTTLTMLDSAGKYHQLASFYWNMHWQAAFKLTNFSAPTIPGNWSIYPNKSGTSSTTGRIILGKVTDPRFQNLVTAGSVPICNTVATNAANSVATPSTSTTKTGRQEKRMIESFDVRQ